MISPQNPLITSIKTRLLVLSACFSLFFLGCTDSQPPSEQTAQNPDLSQTDLGFKPNIVWISTEDIGCTLAAYGDSTAYTPNIDRLAEEGVVFDRAFTVAGVCAPSRSSMITGVHPTSMGTQHMRTRGIELPDRIRPFPMYLREAGYYCTNNVKEDYNFQKPAGTWDESSRTAHWENRQPGQPFFAVFNNIVTHEHKSWANYRNLMALNIDEVPIPEYYPQDNKEVKLGVARVYANIMDLDAHVGLILKQLEEANLMDSTIIVFWSDHGGPLPRQKRELFDSGTKVPLIVRFPDGRMAGTRTDELVSLMDLGPSMLSLLDIDVPEYMQGQPFLGEQKASPREYVYLHRDRMDGQYDLVRGVRDQRYKYFRNYYPDRPNIQQINYRKQMPMMRELYELHGSGQLSGAPAIWFKTSKPVEQLYDTQSDPDEVNNLVDDPANLDKLEELRAAHLAWRQETLDLGAVPEPRMHIIQQETGMPLYNWARENPDRLQAAWAAAELNSPDAALGEIEEAMRDADSIVQYWGIYSLGNRESVTPEQLAFVRQQLQSPAPSVQIAAARTLAKHGESDKAIGHLKSMVPSEVIGVDMMVEYTLAELGVAGE